MRCPVGWFACLGCLLLGVLIPANVARAAGGYPDYGNTRVNDFAHLLAPADVAQLRDLGDELRRSRGIEAVVVTIGSTHDYPAGGSQSFEQFATGLFNSWGIGDRNRNDGVLILVAVRDRKVRVELGSGYPREMDARMAHLIQTDFLPAFKRGDYRGGILQGTKAVYTEAGVWRERDAASGNAAPVPLASSGSGAPAVPYSPPPVSSGNHYNGNLPPVPFHTSSPGFHPSGDFGVVMLFVIFLVPIVVAFFKSFMRGYSGEQRRRGQPWYPTSSDSDNNTFDQSSSMMNNSSSSSSFDSSSSSGGDSFGGGDSSGGGASGSW